VFDITTWLENQIGQSRADVLAAAKLMAVDTKDAVKQSQKGGRAVRGNVTMQMRAQVSAATKADSRMRHFLTFARELKKRPAGITAADWALYEAIVSGWVDHGCVAPEALVLFTK